MLEPENVLISVEGRHTVRMLNGEKTVELRRRPVRIGPRTRVWIYSKIPRGYLEALAIVDNVVEACPRQIWEDFGDRTGISRSEFEAYFSGLDYGYAILFHQIIGLNPLISLTDIRQRICGFQPPQFFKRLSAGSAELAFFRSALLG